MTSFEDAKKYIMGSNIITVLQLKLEILIPQQKADETDCHRFQKLRELLEYNIPKVLDE